ncbi:MAG: thaumatin family protein [Leptospirales bacterium]
MKKLLFFPMSFLFLGSVFMCEPETSPTKGAFLMWQIPGSGVSLPIYIYQNEKQVAYIPDTSLQVFAGSYTPGVTNATYDLYYQKSKQWYSCTFVLSKGSVAASTTTCPGAVINSPVTQNGATSNVYTVAFGTTAWKAVKKKPTNPTKTSYSNRTITFENNTAYPVIQIGEACSLSNGKNSTPSCQNTAIVATIQKNSSYVVTVGLNGLDSAAFHLSSYCTAGSVAECKTAPTVDQCNGANPQPPANWVCTGGYFTGQSPYATKIEFTILKVITGIPKGSSNIDISAVDGYNVGVRLYPSSPEYCTYSVPPENSNVLGAGYYSTKNSLAQVVPKSDTSLSTMCTSSSQLPLNYKGPTKPWVLSKTSTKGAFEGCMSPCTYAKLNGTGNADQFCCTGQYSTPGSCDVAPGDIGANTSTYNTNIQNSSQFKNVYGFAYGDAGSDYACPPDTNFVVEFVSKD